MILQRLYKTLFDPGSKVVHPGGVAVCNFARRARVENGSTRAKNREIDAGVEKKKWAEKKGNEMRREEGRRERRHKIMPCPYPWEEGENERQKGKDVYLLTITK